LEENVVSDSSSVIHLENQQQITCSLPTVQVSSTSSNVIKHDKQLQDTFSTNQSYDKLNTQCKLSADEAKIVFPGNVLNKEIVVVIDSCYNDMNLDMVNSTAQHPKTRNSTSSAIGVNSNNSTTSDNSVAQTRDSTLAKDQITDEANMIMNSKSPLSTITPVIEVSI